MFLFYRLLTIENPYWTTGRVDKSVKKRYKEKSFAAGADREQIARCSELGLELDDFLELGVFGAWTGGFIRGRR